MKKKTYEEKSKPRERFEEAMKKLFQVKSCKMYTIFLAANVQVLERMGVGVVFAI